MKIKLLLCVLFLFISSKADAYWPQKGECFVIDGPANIRDNIKGKLLGTLDSDHIVKIEDVSLSGWFKVSYSEHPDVCGGNITGWTYKFNLKPLATEISELISNKKAQLIYPKEHYPSFMLSYDYDEQGVEVFGELLKMTDEPEQEVLMENPFLLLQYCSDGKLIINELKSVYFAYGGDRGSYLPEFKFKNKISSACLTVNGSIKGVENKIMNLHNDEICKEVVLREKQAYKNSFLNPDDFDMKYNEKMFTCEDIEFPFSKNEEPLYIKLFNRDSAPSFHEWSLWMGDNNFSLGNAVYP